MITFIPEPIEERFPNVPYIDPNITLIIDQYTSDASGTPELFAGAKSMKDVFMHYKPSVEVESLDEKGNAVTKKIHFNNIQDYTEQENISLIGSNVTIKRKSVIQLESAYRTLDLFYQNAGQDRVNNLHLINVSQYAIRNGSIELFNMLDELLTRANMGPDKSRSYSLLVIPGGVICEKDLLMKWANMAHKYGILLITDYCRESSFDDLYNNTKWYRGNDPCLSNVIMTCNWIIGSGRKEGSNTVPERDLLFLPPSAALAGKLYNTPIELLMQGAAGSFYGLLHKAQSVEFDLGNIEIEELRHNHLVPVVCNDCKVMAFGIDTLYNGDNILLSEYPMVRYLNWIEKVVVNYLNIITEEKWDPNDTPLRMKANIHNFFFDNKLFPKPDVKTPVMDSDNHKISVKLELNIHGITYKIVVCQD